MTEDDAGAWAERLGRAFGLVAQDPAVRGAALDRSRHPWARCRAGHVLTLLDRPDLPNSLRARRTWPTGGGAATRWPGNAREKAWRRPELGE